MLTLEDTLRNIATPRPNGACFGTTDPSALRSQPPAGAPPLKALKTDQKKVRVHVTVKK